MQDEDDRAARDLARDICAWATVHQMRDRADELAELARELQRPIPLLPLDPAEREAVLTVLLLQARDQSRRLLTLVSGDDVRSWGQS